MGNWTDRFDPETVDEIKRYEVGEGDFLLAERLAMHKGVESVFGFHVNCLGLGKPYWEKGVYLGDVLDFFDRHGETLIEKRAGSWHGDDGYGNEPNATVAYLSSLEGSREERAFELAKNEYLAWLEHKADRYTTVYGYMGLGDRYEQHLL